MSTGRPTSFPLSRLLPLAITLALALLCWRLHLKVLVPALAVLLLAYYLLLPKLARARLERFHLEALRLLITGKAAEVPKIVRRSPLLRFFAPQGPVSAKLALAYSATGDYLKAVPLFVSAIDSAPEAELAALYSGYASALFFSGSFDRALQEAERLLTAGVRLPETLIIASRCRLLNGNAGDETRALVEEALRASNTPKVAHMAALTELELSLHTGRATAELPELPPQAHASLTAWHEAVTGLLLQKRKGDSSRTRKHLQRAVELDPDGIGGTVARKALGK